MTSVRIEIPGSLLPWQRASRGKRGSFASPEQKAQQSAIQWHWLRSARNGWSVYGRFAVTIDVTWPDHRRRDLDNAQKQILDALTGLAWDDDCHVDDIHARRMPPSKTEPKTIVTVTRTEVV